MTLDVFNLFDVKWNDVEYHYGARLPNEASPHADLAVQAGVPRTARLKFQYPL